VCVCVYAYVWAHSITKQVGRDAASQSHMGSSIVFTRWCQCAPPSNTCFLEPTQVHIPNGISVGSATFAGLIIVTHRPTDQPTDRPRYSAYNNRPRVCTQYCNAAQLLAYNKNSKLSVLHRATMQNRFAVLCLWLTTVTPHRKSRSCDPAIFRKFISWSQNRKIRRLSQNPAQNMPFSGQFPELDFCRLCITTTSF